MIADEAMVKSRRQTRRFQFRLWWLFYVMMLVAVCLAIVRLDVFVAFLIVYGGAMGFVVVCGTSIWVHRRHHYSVVRALITGPIAGSSLALACFGWHTVLVMVFKPTAAFSLIPRLVCISVIGACVGVVIGIVVWIKARRMLAAAVNSLAERTQPREPPAR